MRNEGAMGEGGKKEKLNCGEIMGMGDTSSVRGPETVSETIGSNVNK